MTATPRRTSTRTALPEMTEAQLLDNVRTLAMLTGFIVYHTHDSRRSDAGWPDLVLASPRQRRVLFIELKTPRGRLRPQQGVWLDALARCGAETALWRPEHWHDGTIRRVLQGQRLGDTKEPDA